MGKSQGNLYAYIIIVYRKLQGDYVHLNNEYQEYNDRYDESGRKLYNYKIDSSRKIVEESTTIYEVDNECILKNRRMNKKT